jgi:hypothetical protein
MEFDMTFFSETESRQGTQPKEREADMPYTVSGIPAPMISLLWEFADPFVRRALHHANSELLPDDLKKSCLNRDMQLLLVHHGVWVVGAVITEIILSPHKKHCRIIIIAGDDISAWAGVLDTVLMAWAQSLGCHVLEIPMLDGLRKTLHSLGYRQNYGVAIKSL